MFPFYRYFACFFLFSVLIAACLTTFLLAALYEGLKIFQVWLVSRPLRLLIMARVQSPSTSDVLETSGALSNNITSQQSLSRISKPRYISTTNSVCAS